MVDIEKNKINKLRHKIKKILLKIENKRISPIFYIAKIKNIYRRQITKCLRGSKIVAMEGKLNLYQKYYNDILERADNTLKQISDIYGNKDK